MIRNQVLLCSAIIIASCLSAPSSAQERDVDARQVDVQRLQQEIDAQQRQLDTQNSQLRELRRQLQQLAGTAEKSVATAAGIPPRRNDLQTDRRDDKQALDDWQGSFVLQGSDTRIKIGGFLQLDVIHDNDAIGSKGQLIADSIPTRNSSKLDGADGQTSFSVSPSRLYVETRTPLDDRRLKTYLSMDMFDDELGVDASPRLRQAYVELGNSLFGGDLLIGQAWSTTTDLEATPDVLDFRGPDSLFGRLQPQLRWSKSLAEGVRLMLAAETPNNHIIEGADSLTRMPDGIIAVTWDSTRFNLMGSLIASDLRASMNNGPVETVVGFGGNISGKIELPYGRYPEHFMFSVTYGRGIGSHFNNAKPDAVYDPGSASLKAIHLYGVTLGYSHSWNARMKSTLVYCCIEIDNQDVQAADAIQKTEYSSGNLLWTMNPRWLLGIEGIWGKRRDKDDVMATVFRTQFSSRLSF